MSAPVLKWISLHGYQPLSSGIETKGSGVEVKIGVTDSPREIIFNSGQKPEELEKLVTAALAQTDKGPAVLTLTDDKGRRFLVQASRITYVELGPVDSRRVGFGIGEVAAGG